MRASGTSRCGNSSRTTPVAASAWRSTASGVYLDYSKNRVTDTTLALLVQLAAESGLRERIDAMFRGDRINNSENRAVLHVALRAPRGASIVVDGKNVVPDVHAVLDRMAEFADRVRSGAWKGHTGKRIRNVINVGIGGSDLGPVMAYEALKRYSDRAMTFRFVSNVDGTDFAEAVAGPRRRGDAVRHFVEDVHDAGDDDQREHRAGLVAGRTWAATPPPWPGTSSRCRPTPTRCRRSASTPPTCSVSGIGWAGAIRWTPPSACRRCSPWVRRISARMLAGFHADGRALPHGAFRAQPAGADGPHRRLVRRLLRRADGRGAALRAIPEALPRVPAAVDDGEQRQARHAGRCARRLCDGPRLLGRARHQRPAFVLPADPPGHAPHSVRLHRVRQGAAIHWGGTTTSCWPTCLRRPRRWRSARPRPR